MRIPRPITRTIFKLTGWRQVSQSVPTSGVGILIGAPHTSNWDFPGMLVMTGDLGISIKYFGKASLFKRPFGGFMRMLGGIPIDRSNPARIVADIIARIKGGERFYLVITPEGTRGKGKYWKSGFYRIALDAGLDITLGYIDRPTKTIGLGPTFTPSGDVVADMDFIREFYADKQGWHPELRTEPRLREEDRGKPKA